MSKITNDHITQSVAQDAL